MMELNIRGLCSVGSLAALIVSGSVCAAPAAYQVAGTTSQGYTFNSCYLFDGTKDEPTLKINDGPWVPIRWGDNNTKRSEFLYAKAYNGGSDGPYAYMIFGTFLNQRSQLKAQTLFATSSPVTYMTSTMTGTLVDPANCWWDTSPVP